MKSRRAFTTVKGSPSSTSERASKTKNSSRKTSPLNPEQHAYDLAFQLYAAGTIVDALERGVEPLSMSAASLAVLHTVIIQPR